MEYKKDGVTVAIHLDTSHPKQGGRYAAKVRVTYQRKRQYYPTGKDFTKEEFIAVLTSKARDKAAIRKDLESSFGIVRNAVEQLTQTGGFSLDKLNTFLGKATGETVNTAFKAKIAYLFKTDRVGNATVYDTVLKGLERFGGAAIPFRTVTVTWLNRYAEFLRREGKRQTTIAIHLRTLRAILNEARLCGIVKESDYPFGRGRYEIQSGTGRKMALTLEQIGQVARYDNGSLATAKYRDYWLFLYLCNGINVADFVRLRHSDIVNGEIYFVRQKTAHTSHTLKDIQVVVTQPMQEIIDRWGTSPTVSDFIFPILNGTETAIEQKHKTQYLTRAINKHMAAIAATLGIPHISTYTARHSFATVLKRSGANIAYISESLGHSDLKTTENYLASFEREERTKNAELLTKF